MRVDTMPRSYKTTLKGLKLMDLLQEENLSSIREIKLRREVGSVGDSDLVFYQREVEDREIMLAYFTGANTFPDYPDKKSKIVLDNLVRQGYIREIK